MVVCGDAFGERLGMVEVCGCEQKRLTRRHQVVSPRCLSGVLSVKELTWKKRVRSETQVFERAPYLLEMQWIQQKVLRK